MCGCNNGRLTCTDIDECKDRSEDRDDAEQRCDRCQDAPARLVCGRDGRTFRSRCVAMNCSGLGENDILDGPCSSQVGIIMTNIITISLLIPCSCTTFKYNHIAIYNIII